MKNKQLVIRKFSNEIHEAAVIIENSIPKLSSKEVLVKNMYIGINALYDRELYRGNVPYIQMKFPYVFGVESVGEVIAIGKQVKHLKKGDAVSTVKVGTAYQQYQVIPESEGISIPEATPEYLTLNPTGVSAYLALKKVAELKPKETIVVSAAAGGLGHIVVQLAKQKECHVIAICGTEQKVALLKTLNCCDRIINHRDEDVATILDTEYASKIDVGFDSVGRHIFDTFLKNLAPLGRLVISGIATEINEGKFQEIKAPRVYESIYWKGASVRCFMNHLFKEEHSEARNILYKQYENKELQIKVDTTIFTGIEAIMDASEYLLQGRSCGKVVVAL
ncbi:zinc-binding dehydrogenase [Aquimarina sp. RZ0]|uniref:zinc-binding dehydrogenase n=1 Tax=Aquimarina sp. RZ0 TaxID=2607730 RepID=UPI0011F197D8|nr:zinc-binding dehydrogenase [Aquimarina sp. RZ0]KAA1244937.1 zinc-binding dehydrogenase [Aquimarina sp. RZ0]